MVFQEIDYANNSHYGTFYIVVFLVIYNSFELGVVIHKLTYFSQSKRV